MPRTPAKVTQADISRAIRALRNAGFSSVRVVMRDGGVIVEPAEVLETPAARRLADRERVVVL